jgi:hypothetical protein
MDDSGTRCLDSPYMVHVARRMDQLRLVEKEVSVADLRVSGRWPLGIGAW